MAINKRLEHSAEPASEMHVHDHLAELRKRLIITIAAFVILAVIAYCLTDSIFSLLRWPLMAYPVQFAFFTMTEAFMARVQTAMAVSLFLSGPLIFYHLMAFIGPGLYERERRLLRNGFAASVPFVLTGFLFGYMVLVPLTLRMLFIYGSGYMVPVWSGQLYMKFIFMATLLSGFIFSLPLLVLLLGKLGLLASAGMRKARGAIVLAVLAAEGLLGLDAVAMAISVVPVWVLNEGVLWAVRRMERRKRRAISDQETV